MPGSLAHRIYGATTVAERHRHRYEVNNHYLPRLEAAGLVVGARANSAIAGDLCEMIELPAHPWFFGCQFHPEFTSNPRRGHPLFIGFVRAALAQQRRAHGRRRARRRASAELVASDLDARSDAMKLCGFEVGLDRPLFLIAGPCVVESLQLQIDVAGQLKEICAALGIPFIFKSSYDKANRSSGDIVPRAGHGRRACASWPRSSARSACRC